MQVDQVIKNLPKSFMAIVQNSVGSRSWQNFHAAVDGVEQDVLRGGELSCAYFASSILATFGMIDRSHATVLTIIEKLPEYDWHQVDQPKPGDLLVWENVKIGNESHSHIGFYIGDDQAISNSSKQKVPIKHDWLFRDDEPRRITSIWHRDF